MSASANWASKVLPQRISFSSLSFLPSREPGLCGLLDGHLSRLSCGLSLRAAWYIYIYVGFLGSSVVKNPPAMQEMQLRLLGWVDPLEEGMATRSSIPAMDRGAWWATVHGVAKSGTRLR